MTKRLALSTVYALMMLQPIEAQGLLPLDIEAVYCLGVMDEQAAGVEALIKSMPTYDGKAFKDLPPVFETRSSIKTYLIARGIIKDANIAIASKLKLRGENDVRACVSAESKIPSDCKSMCIQQNLIVSGADKFIEKIRECTSLCEGGTQRNVLCSKIKHCDSLKDRLPL